MSREFLFDVKLLASIRVNAETEEEARVILREALDCADVNAGTWGDGSPIIFEASMFEADLVE